MFRFCDDFVTRWAALDPVGIGGSLAEPFGAATDYSPSGLEAWADLTSGTLAELGGVPVTSERDRLAAAHLRDGSSSLGRRLRGVDPMEVAGKPCSTSPRPRCSNMRTARCSTSPALTLLDVCTGLPLEDDAVDAAGPQQRRGGQVRRHRPHDRDRRGLAQRWRHDVEW